MRRRPLLLLWMVMFLVMSGFGIIIPVLPFLAEEVGATPLELGLLMAVYSLMQLLFSPVWGQLSDRYGRKPVLLIGITGLSLSFFLFSVAETLIMLFVARFLGGALSAAAMPTVMAYAADVTPPDERGKAMGAIGAATGLGFICGPAIGGMFSQTSLHLPFAIAGALSAATALFVWLALPEPSRLSTTAKSEGQRSLREMIQSPLLYLYLLQWTATLALAGLEATFAYFADRRAGLDSVQLGYIFMIMGIASALVQGGLLGRLIKRFGEGRVLQGGLAVSALGFAAILLVQDFWTAALFLSIFGIGNGVIRPCVSSLITKQAAGRQGSAAGLLSSFDSLGRIIGPIVGGGLFSYMAGLPYLLGIVLCVVGAGLYGLFAARNEVGRLSS
ncbi:MULTISPECIES: MFS transporter [Geobacillus]|jgi:multidrug resistance protein|uniref:Multidrug-efflux transporter n=4 Tax=Geobacillus thermodenitrificans TaxID=33940 RepID=A4INA5_GEOTN|nr:MULTISPECIES: tetracycline resistance MFS efflux pump [Geobacillus]ABO66809.1 Multidrug-efflux transporter [Geobacillus thermodenitrificans NG80-2]ARP42576.1 Multidrug resistance protein 2 [Geobacillus thermodenitrificans]ATO36112.1 tetracycline resistance MFS efflux pump [Geobacillus thermodenitrificans]KQB93517.1 major facilitator transporter [Geobacillus sp. PA-3]MEC5186473.1 multidrug resistance protein [Geobacillus thermodenitrificans]